MKITVIGAGSWGTALAVLLGRNGHQVTLWARDESHVADMATTRHNHRYLPDILLPDTLMPSNDLDAAMQDCDWVLLAIPSHVFRTFVSEHKALFRAGVPVFWATKGFEQKTGKFLSQVVQEELGNVPMGIISGPTFAKEVAAGMPTAVTVACEDESLAMQVADSLHNDTFRAYTVSDLIGVQLGGAVKNVLAIAAGASDGLGFGANARAALITRGLAEVMRLGAALGAHKETLMGLAGLGDLILTCTDNQSRNRRFGLALAEGQSVEQALETIGQAVEGVKAAASVVALARRNNLEMPICEQVDRVIEGHLPPSVAVKALLGRAIKPESL